MSTGEAFDLTRAEAMEQVLTGLQALILSSARSLSSEQEEPSLDVDRSEAKMTVDRKRVVELRAMRARFEEIMTGVVGL